MPEPKMFHVTLEPEEAYKLEIGWSYNHPTLGPVRVIAVSRPQGEVILEEDLGG